MAEKLAGLPRLWTLSQVERLERLSIPEPNSGCWIWVGSTHHSGYGSYRLLAHPRKLVNPHRYYYQLTVGEIPEGLVLDHLCNTPICINPDHLEPVTLLENFRRGRERKLLRESQRMICEATS